MAVLCNELGHAVADPQTQTARLNRKRQLTPEQSARIEPVLKFRQRQVQLRRANTAL